MDYKFFNESTSAEAAGEIRWGLGTADRNIQKCCLTVLGGGGDELGGLVDSTKRYSRQAV